MKPGKGNGVVSVVILNKDDYNKKMDAILSDTSKFQLLNEDPVKVVLQRENQVKALLKKLKAASSLNEKKLRGTISYWLSYRYTIRFP